MCERWRNFNNFYFDMGDRPEGTSIDRIDNEKGYEPSNCVWSTRKTQNQNRRDYRPAILVNNDGETVKVSRGRLNDFCREYDLSVSHISSVLLGRRKNHKGWSGGYVS